MKKIPALLLLLRVFIGAAQAQTVERSLAAGFITSVELVKPFSEDKWLMACSHDPYAQNNLFVAVIGHEGHIHLRKTLTLPIAETHYWHDVLALPDGGFLASFESTLCDVGADILTIQRLDAQGNLMWEKSGGFFFGTPRPPANWFLATDGNLLGTAYNEVWKINPINGDILWKAELQGVSGGAASPNQFALIAGTEDFFALGNPDFQVWRKAGSPGPPVYVLENSLDMPGYRNQLAPAQNGWFYCFQHFPEKKVERINLALQYEALPILVDAYESFNIAVSNEGLYLAETSADYINRLRKFDFSGLNEADLPAPNSWIRGFSVDTSNGWLALAGNESSGSEVWIQWSEGPQRSTGAWIRTFPEISPLPISETPNAAVTEIEQLYAIDTTRFPNGPSDYIYNLMGGGFRVKITNLGNAPINQVCVNTSFRRNAFFHICYRHSAHQKQFSNLNLDPGESAWLDFGDIEANGQTELPSEICFWTSSPNEQPDAIHEDDRACHPASYTVGLKSPGVAQLSLLPNPADGFAEISFSENMEGEQWQIFDTAGREVSVGTCSNSLTLRLETAHLPNGLYFFRVKSSVAKVVVQH